MSDGVSRMTLFLSNHMPTLCTVQYIMRADDFYPLQRERKKRRHVVKEIATHG